jgi:KAP family P-loop domain
MATIKSEKSESTLQSSPQEEIELSSSVNAVVSELFDRDEVSASLIAARLLRLHKEYAEGRAGRINLTEDPSTTMRKSIAEWLTLIRSLYDASKVSELHGRLIILGLSILDWELAKELSVNNFLSILQKEIRSSFDSLLTPSGHEMWRSMLDHLEHQGQIDTVPTHLDTPAQVDELGRRSFAKVLALRIRAIRDKEAEAHNNGSLILHIHGPWGSGKTSLLNFLGNELKQGDTTSPWVVVNFNAWMHQRLGSPWWWLMNEVFRQGTRQLWKINRWRSIKLWVREYLWRFMRAGWPPYLLALLGLALVFWLISLNGFFGLLDLGLDKTATGSSKVQLKQIGDAAESISAIIALIITVWGIVFGLSRSLMMGSVRGASNFIESIRDPMKTFTDHFNDLVCKIGKPVAIFIDDMDRCQGSYIVELLEGIQTLFIRAPVTYVVAADRHWISASYDQAYDAFARTVEDVGRPLGYLFLEKAFQLSTSVPALSPISQAAYWQRLLQINQAEHQEKLDIARANAKKKLQTLQTDDSILEELKHISDPIEEQAFREEAVKRLAAPDVQVRTEHGLKAFAHLLEPNPRAMKRLINSYGLQRAIATLVKVDIGMKQLALWTILLLRWPVLAEYLEDHPEIVEHFSEKLPAGEKLPVSIPEELHKLFQDESVRNVINGKNVGICLDANAISYCAYLRA